MEKSSFRVVSAAALLHVAAAGLLFLLAGCHPEAEEPVLETLRLAAYRGEFSALIWVADEKGFFAENGLEVILREFDNGVEPVREVIAGRADMATAGEFVFVMHSFTNPTLRAIASIDSADAIDVIALKERGVAATSDLKGKRIGLKKSSQADYFLSVLLLFHGLSSDDVEIVDLNPSAMTEALRAETVDAVVVWDPFTFHIKQAFDGAVNSWSAQKDTKFYFLLNVMQELVERNPAAIKRFLAAMLQAERFITEEHEEAQRLIEQRIGTAPGYLKTVWGDNDFRVSLPQTMIMALESEADWAIRKKMTSSAQVPNYLAYLYPAGLKELKPDAVDLIQ